jgi:hypothetical protein
MISNHRITCSFRKGNNCTNSFVKISNTNEHDTLLFNIRQEKVQEFIDGNHSNTLFIYNVLFLGEMLTNRSRSIFNQSKRQKK